MDLMELEAEVKTLREKLRTLEDIEQINRLENIYGYYLDNYMWDEIVDLFSDNTESIELGSGGVYLGKEGVRKFFLNFMGRDGEPRPSWWMHVTHQIQPVIDVAQDGQTAQGRWQALMCLTLLVDGEVRPAWGQGVYENEFVKENGKWLFKKLRFYINFRTPYEDGWVKTPIIGEKNREKIYNDTPSTVYAPYPSGYIVPFHYRHPITGK